MNKIYIGIDNGVTGSIGIIDPIDFGIYGKPTFQKIPIITQQNYTKKKGNISRVNSKELGLIFKKYLNYFEFDILVILERPLVNPTMFKATLSAVRCLESTLCLLEYFQFPYMYVDSKKWQRELLPKDCHGPELKQASHDIGIRLFPHLKKEIDKHKDADGILIAEWARRNNL